MLVAARSFTGTALALVGGIFGKGGGSEIDDAHLLKYLRGRYGAKGWNLVDETGPIPFDVEQILGDYSLARPVANWASDQGWGNLVMAPFLQEPVTRSRNGRTPVTTSFPCRSITRM